MDLELTVVQRARSELGYITGLAVGEELVVAAGGTSAHAPVVLASSNVRHFEPRKTPRQLGLRDVLIAGDALWVCGEYGQLALSRDRGAAWKLLDTGTDVCLFALALAADGAVWAVGDAGYVARIYEERLERIDLKTTARLAAVYCLRDETIMLGGDGLIYRWRAGVIAKITTGAPKPLTALAITKAGSWLVIGDGGFVARSPDGAWFSRAKSGVEIDLEAITSLSDGRVVMVGDRGIIMVSADDGRTWTTISTDVTSHLWSVERFGASGVLIGGDDGLILKLAPPGDTTWEDRINVFGGVQPLDAVFSGGPEGFLARLPAFVAAVEAEPIEIGQPNADAFARIYGVALPGEVEALFAATRDRDCFEELRLDLPPATISDIGEENVFEHVLSGGVSDAFCGTFCIGSQGNGDTYHCELYEWDGPRQVLHFDHETQTFTGVVADSVESLVYLAALIRARETRQVSDQAFSIGLRKLRGKVAPTWHFEIQEHDPEFSPLDAKRRDSEFFFYRSRWICALLDAEGFADVTDIRPLFMADFNQVLPADQLQARFEACEKIIPTALYAMWRAYFFGEPELARYLEIGRRHKSRLVRDAAKLVDELLAGRNHLGAITDIRARIEAFRALDLDPRRADQREVEAEARARADEKRHEEVQAELAKAPRSAWADLAWRWLDDGVAHRVLLAKLVEAPELAAQISMLDELRGLSDDERPLVLERLAKELAPELEAILVGSLVRDDDLAGVLPRPDIDEDDNDVDDEDEPGAEEASPGWDAIDAALEPIYRGVEPHAHFGTIVPYALGGNDPLHGISVYLRDEPVPHFHLVTYGFTDLFDKDTDEPDVSGFGFELTMRLARKPGETDTPAWALNLLQNLARYVFSTGNRFGLGHKMGLNGPIALDHDTRLTAVLFADDHELGELESEYGKARFLQLVGITDDEYALIQEWSSAGLIEILRRKLPALVTDLERESVLDDPAIEREVKARVAAEGSSEEVSFAGDMDVVTDDGVQVEMGALYAAAFARAMRGRLPHGRSYTLRGRNATLRLTPGDASRLAEADDDDEGVVELVLAPDTVAEIAAKLEGAHVGTYTFETWADFQLVVTPTIIRDPSGKPIGVRGVTDPDEVARLLEDAPAAPTATPRATKPSEDRARAALAMTQRALRLAPDDDDTQFTHAMLLLDANQIDELLADMPGYTPSNRVNIVSRMAQREQPRIAEAIDIVANFHAEAYSELPEGQLHAFVQTVLEQAPDRLASVVELVPDNITALTELAYAAIEADERDAALEIYERVLALPIPDGGEDRTAYLQALNNACIQAHTAGAFDTAVRIADRAQPIAHENPYIYHSAACAYAAVGDHAKALAQVKLAIEHDYDHLPKVETDRDLGPLLESPEFKALFRDWHARKEGN